MKKGFTLMELLVVVLIIGVLSSVAISGYRKAVEKSRVADALNTMSAVAKSEHNWYLIHNEYTDDFSDLDTTFTDRNGETAEDASFESLNYTFTLQGNNIRAARNNGEYTLYKLYEEGNIFCLPKDHYVCQQYAWGINRKVCDSINGAWSNIQADCYNSVQERCLANDGSWAKPPAISKVADFCGYWNPTDPVDVKEFERCRYYTSGGLGGNSNKCNNSTFTGEGSSCIGDSGGCSNSGFYQGAKCSGTCINSTFDQGSTCNGSSSSNCQSNTFNNGSVCNSSGIYACNGSTFTAGSKCIVTKNYAGCAGGTYYEGSECHSGPDTGGYPGCNNVILKAGSKCFADTRYGCTTVSWLGANGGTGGGYHGTIFEPGSYCVGEAANSCKGFSNFKAICVANASGACANTYTGPGCCEGTYCPANSPKCYCEADENGVHPKSC